MKLLYRSEGRRRSNGWMDGAIIDELLQILCIILNRGDEDSSYKDLTLASGIKR